MIKSSSYRLNRQYIDSILFILPGCTKCRKAESKLRELNIPYQAYNIFEHRALFQSVPIEKKSEGLPLLKIQENYYSLTEILDLKKQEVSIRTKVGR
ncbi:glutaredoxin domain-containing protein [Planococcus halocryophilus]|uniref:glutaredoxin domain-containing protein n=1 Tax=Planococcus halocryophilus TaxID=1215089 RepID=UPI001F0E81EE|nr:glutaredoxin domain-containing protein [Planococcus halocryophilus]MCH4825248.1 glutaredoxin [Planococcus halocryophilus]